MTIHPPLLTAAPISSRADIFRLKALFSEERAQESTSHQSRLEWEELAIEWHTMANLAAGLNRDTSKVDIARWTALRADRPMAE
jgi:hypothetical protein